MVAKKIAFAATVGGAWSARFVACTSVTGGGFVFPKVVKPCNFPEGMVCHPIFSHKFNASLVWSGCFAVWFLLLVSFYIDVPLVPSQ